MNTKKAKKRTEFDSLGAVQIPSSMLYGPQTQRAMQNFIHTNQPIPASIIKYYGAYKYASCAANLELNLLEKEKGNAILAAALKVFKGELNAHFPLQIWQSGSGTQTNMNVNEVIANTASAFLQKDMGDKSVIHPNDMVNLNQSSNDTFSIVMNLSAYFTGQNLINAIQKIITALQELSIKAKGIVKISRTHLQDAVAMQVEEEYISYVARLKSQQDHINTALLDLLLHMPIGGTAIGNGINCHKQFSSLCAKKLGELLNIDVNVSKVKHSDIEGHDSLCNLSSLVKTLASIILKIANDLRMNASGPRCGFGEINLPSLEPGSSIMPGKVNPGLIESVIMGCYSVFGYDAIVTNCNAHGNFQLNVTRPVMIYHLLLSIDILTKHLAKLVPYVTEITFNKDKLQENYQKSLMHVTKLVPTIGYDKAAKLAQFAHTHKISLIEANNQLQLAPKDEITKILTKPLV